MRWPHGVLPVDKPAGTTSRRVAETVQKALRPARRPRRGAPRFRCGHAGTLDPMATGLLLVLVGSGTRLNPFLVGCDKTYEAVVRFGVATDTLDAEGEVVTAAPAAFAVADIDAAIAARVGPQDQTPPIYSALKRDGRSLHRRVRAGEDVAPPEPRPIVLHELVRTAEPIPGPQEGTIDVALRVSCSTGTYIRSLARDLGEDLGLPAHLAALRRTRVGPFDLEGAVTAEPGDPDLRAICLDALIPPAAALAHLPAIVLDTDEAEGVRQGRQPVPEWLERLDGPPTPTAHGGEPLWRMLDPSGELVAVGRIETADGGEDGEDAPRIAAVFPDPSQEATCT